MSNIIEFKKQISGHWCNNTECIYSQNGYCICGSELVFTKNYVDVKGKQKPLLICSAFIKK